MLENTDGDLTVSGRFLSLSSSLSKHCLRILFSDIHITWKHTNTTLFIKLWAHFHYQPSRKEMWTRLLQVPEEQVIVLVQKPWQTQEQNTHTYILVSHQPQQQISENVCSSVQLDAHTIDIVVDLSSVVQQSELLSAHHLPGLCISQLVTGRKNTSAARVGELLLLKYWLWWLLWSLLAESGTELTWQSAGVLQQCSPASPGRWSHWRPPVADTPHPEIEKGQSYTTLFTRGSF